MNASTHDHYSQTEDTMCDPLPIIMTPQPAESGMKSFLIMILTNKFC